LSKLPDLQSLVILVSAKGKQRSYPAGRKRPQISRIFLDEAILKVCPLLIHTILLHHSYTRLQTVSQATIPSVIGKYQELPQSDRAAFS
jgi:hypothetical protein